MLPDPPRDTYWVPLPGGSALAGPHPVLAPEGIEERVQMLIDRYGIRSFVDLSSSQDWMPPYTKLLTPECRYTRYEIEDRRTPSDPDGLHEVLQMILRDTEDGVVTYMHCQAGLGRTGTVVGCLLREAGLEGDMALEELIRMRAECGLHPGSPEFEAQRVFVREWEPR